MKVSSLRNIWMYACCFWITSGLLAQARMAPDFGDSITWADRGEAPSLTSLEGKSVIVIFFQSWCGICNGWSGKMFKDIENAYRNDPQVLIVALKTDGGSIEDAKSYLASRADSSDWLVGVDKNATYYKNLAGTSKLYYYAWIKPDGTLGEVSKSGSYFTLKNGKKCFTLAYQNNLSRFRKDSKALFPEAQSWGGDLKEAVSAAEKGRFLTALKLANQTKNENTEKFKSTIAQKVQTSLTKLTTLVNDSENENRYSAFLKLNHMAESYGSSPQGKAAREAVNAQQRQAWIRDEKEAHKDYRSIMKRAARADDERSRARIKKALQKLHDEFPETYYGRLAGPKRP